MKMETSKKDKTHFRASGLIAAILSGTILFGVGNILSNYPKDETPRDIHYSTGGLVIPGDSNHDGVVDEDELRATNFYNTPSSQPTSNSAEYWGFR